MQINAFNFPVWGFLEKLAPAFIAGVPPSIIKPASQTAYLTELVVRRIIESCLLPEGSIQLICGSTDDLLDHLDGQDSVAFTGSAATAALLRSHPGIVAAGTHFTAEADSLNASILGPDVAVDDPEFDLFVKQLVTEMTVKAGQKCTAIRRALVPADRVDAVIEATSARLAKVVVGDPPVPMGGSRWAPWRVSSSARRSAPPFAASPNPPRSSSATPEHVDAVGTGTESGAFMSPDTAARQ